LTLYSGTPENSVPHRQSGNLKIQFPGPDPRGKILVGFCDAPLKLFESLAGLISLPQSQVAFDLENQNVDEARINQEEGIDDFQGPGGMAGGVEG